MANWDDGTTWDSGALWDSASPPPLPTASNLNKKRTSTMKRQPYFPRTIDGRPHWFANYATQLPIANATLGLPAAAVTASVNDADYAHYITGNWLTAARETGPAFTAAVDEFLSTDGVGPFAPPTFTSPPLGGVVPVPAGVLNRIFLFVQTIKSSPNYTEAIGLQLGIVGSEDTAQHPLPTFTVKVLTGADCDCARLDFKKFSHKGVAVYSRVGTAPEVLLGIDLATPYLDARPLAVAGVAEKRHYRLRFYDDDGPNGDFTDTASVTISPT